MMKSLISATLGIHLTLEIALIFNFDSEHNSRDIFSYYHEKLHPCNIELRHDSERFIHS